jgi:GGDEF domain-containing protein
MDAFYDRETRLATWELFQELLNHHHDQVARSGDMFAVALVDARCEGPDGADVTSSCRREIAAALQSGVRTTDVVAIGPRGLFVILMENVADWLGATVCVERVLRGLPGDGRGLPVRLANFADRELFLKIRIGVAISRPMHPSLAQTLTEAQAALDRCVEDATFEFAIFDEQRDTDRIGARPQSLSKIV